MGTLVTQGATPVFTQFLANYTAYAATLLGAINVSPPTGLVGGGVAFVDAIFTDSIPALVAAAVALLHGDVTDALKDVAQAFIAPPQAFVNVVVDSVEAVANAIATHVVGLVATIPAIVAAIHNVIVAPNPLTNLVTSTQEAIGYITAALSPFNPLGLLSALVSAPGIILDAVINGTGTPPGVGGILSSASAGGPIATFQEIQGLIATAIGPPKQAAANTVPTAQANTVPTAQANTVTLKVASNTKSSVPVTTTTSTTPTFDKTGTLKTGTTEKTGTPLKKTADGSTTKHHKS
ncbi:MAG TPA: hypothetical protein VMU34_07640 [Mycobacterium sp.]|nr:hypothetical protein [Mycobacterium sp.]